MKRFTLYLSGCWMVLGLAAWAGTPAAATNAAPSGVVEAAVDSSAAATNGAPEKAEYELKLKLAGEQRRQKSLDGAAETLESLLTTNAPPEFQRRALLELALVAQDGKKWLRAQQILAQWLHVYADDPEAPEILLRQGLLYREMGVNVLAISKFYAVMSSALKLRVENINYYKKLVLQSQMEIANTYYAEGKFAESADFFSRILKDPEAEPDREQLEYKLVRSVSFLTNQVDTVSKAQVFLEQFPQSSDVPEVRFLLAAGLKGLGRNQDSMKQVLLLLQSQQENVKKDPETWIYWQRRAGNEIANQLYKEADYLDALEIYLTLADLDKSPGWQVPVWYQAGMVYEQLQQWQKATDIYAKIMGRQGEFNATNSTPMLSSLVEMAKWRKDYIAWLQKARLSNMALSGEWSNAPTANAP